MANMRTAAIKTNDQEKEFVTSKLGMSIIGSVTVGSKGQVVIPKEVRSELNINEGDKLMVMTKGGIAVGLVKADDVPRFLAYMQTELDECTSKNGISENMLLDT